MWFVLITYITYTILYNPLKGGAWMMVRGSWPKKLSLSSFSLD